VATSRRATIHTSHRPQVPERSTVRFANHAAMNHTTTKATQHTAMNRPASSSTSVSIASVPVPDSPSVERHASSGFHTSVGQPTAIGPTFAPLLLAGRGLSRGRDNQSFSRAVDLFERLPNRMQALRRALAADESCGQADYVSAGAGAKSHRGVVRGHRVSASAWVSNRALPTAKARSRGNPVEPRKV
jgi:hypothetical protein